MRSAGQYRVGDWQHRHVAEWLFLVVKSELVQSRGLRNVKCHESAGKIEVYSRPRVLEIEDHRLISAF